MSADHQLETARAHLRLGDAQGALALLRDLLPAGRVAADPPGASNSAPDAAVHSALDSADAHPAALHADPHPADRRIAEIRRYAELRNGAGDADGALEPAVLERVLGWLTREELATAEAAIRDQQFTAALRACDAAWRIDHRGAHVALLRATALLRRLRVAVAGKSPPELAIQRAHLEEADRWIRETSALDPARHAERDAIARAIDADLRRVDEEQRVEPVKDLVGRFNTIMRVYPESPTRMEAANMRSSLAVLAADVERMQRRYAADGPEGRRLSELSITIAGVLVELR